MLRGEPGGMVVKKISGSVNNGGDFGRLLMAIRGPLLRAMMRPMRIEKLIIEDI